MILSFRNIDQALVPSGLLRPFPGGDGLRESSEEKDVNGTFNPLCHAPRRTARR